MKTPRTLVLFLLVACLLFGQDRQTDRFVATDAVTLAGAGETLTIQQPATGSRMVAFDGAAVYCSVACSFTLKWNGTPATTTTLVPAAFPSNTNAVTAKAFSASNVGGGTTGPTYNVAAGNTIVLDLSKLYLQPSAPPGWNFSIAVASMTGNATIVIQWGER